MGQGPPKDYFERRAEEERAASERASDERAAHSHRELAAHYRRRARETAPATAEAVDDSSLSKRLRILH